MYSIPRSDHGTAGSPVASSGSHLLHLDFLRAVAVMLVFVPHFVNSVAATTKTGLGTAAHLGVVFFFVHTSLVLFMSLERMPQAFRAQRFYIRRAFRIYPLAIVTIIAVIWAGFPPSPWIPPFHITRGDVVSNLFLVENVTQNRDILSTLWSLPFEVQMYLCLPLLFALRDRIHPIVFWAGSLAAVRVLLAVSPSVGEVLRYVPCFAGGFIAYWLIRGQHLYRFQFFVMPLAIATGLVLYVGVGHFTGFSSIGDGVAALGAGILVGMMNGYVPPLLSRISGVIAKYSYGIYLSHVPLMMLCFRSGHGPARLVEFLILSVAVPGLVYHTIENPMVAAGVRLSNSIGQRA